MIYGYTKILSIWQYNENLKTFWPQYNNSVNKFTYRQFLEIAYAAKMNKYIYFTIQIKPIIYICTLCTSIRRYDIYDQTKICFPLDYGTFTFSYRKIPSNGSVGTLWLKMKKLWKKQKRYWGPSGTLIQLSLGALKTKKMLRLRQLNEYALYFSGHCNAQVGSFILQSSCWMR